MIRKTLVVLALLLLAACAEPPTGPSNTYDPTSVAQPPNYPPGTPDCPSLVQAGTPAGSLDAQIKQCRPVY
jgi:hypothetical protein